MSEKIIYEAHPVTPERVAELHAQGYIIVDEIYKPRAATAQDAAAEPSPAAPVAAPQPSEDEYRALVAQDQQTAEAGDHAAAAKARRRNRV